MFGPLEYVPEYWHGAESLIWTGGGSANSKTPTIVLLVSEHSSCKLYGLVLKVWGQMGLWPSSWFLEFTDRQASRVQSPDSLNKSNLVRMGTCRFGRWNWMKNSMEVDEWFGNELMDRISAIDWIAVINGHLWATEPIVHSHRSHYYMWKFITFFKRGPADPSQQWKRASNSIQPRSYATLDSCHL
jgi:hypothetical protein